MNNLRVKIVVASLVASALITQPGCGGQSSSSGRSMSSSNGNSNVSANTGRGGSLARFVAAGDTLYTISGASLKLYDISVASSPKSGAVVRVAEDIETLFTAGDYLYIGSQTGLYIYDKKDPSYPNFISSLVHVRSCDPVVVSDNYAFVTLRGGSACGGFTNRLDVIDTSDIYNPVQVAQFPMAAPEGLGMLDKKLYVCDTTGLTVFDASQPTKLEAIDIRPDIECKDVIPNGDVLITTGPGEVSQFKPAPGGLVRVSTIKEDV